MVRRKEGHLLQWEWSGAGGLSEKEGQEAQRRGGMSLCRTEIVPGREHMDKGPNKILKPCSSSSKVTRVF